VPEVPPPTPDDIKAQVEARIREEADHFPEPVATPAASAIDSERVMQCLANNERGDGILYADLQRDRFLFVKDDKKWLTWRGHHWRVDKKDEYLRGVEVVAMAYLDEAVALDTPIKRTTDSLLSANAEVAAAKSRVKAAEKASDTAAHDQADREAKAAAVEANRIAGELSALTSKRKALTRRVERLRSLVGAKNCATWAHVVENPLAIVGEELDQRPWLLACENGVIDLETAELLPGRPADLLVKSVPIEYLGIDTPCPDWDALLESSLPDPEIRLFIQRLFGYAITGFCHEQILACFTGEGSNGKGVIFETIQAILSDLCWRILPEMILEQKTPRNSASVSTDIIALRGRRIVIASETDEHCRISAAKVKELTGADTLNARGLFVEETNFGPTHTLFIQSNHIPHGLTADFALRRRLVLIPFLYSFVDDIAAEELKTPARIGFFKKKDDQLTVNLKGQYPGILAWLVRGCIMWQRQGLAPPPQIVANIEEHRVAEDYLEQFLSSHCLRPFNPKRVYNQGDMAQFGKEQYVSDKDGNQGNTLDSAPNPWRYVGAGIKGDEWIPFKEFRELYQKWFVERITEGKKYLPTSRGIGKKMREKGFVTLEKAGQTRLFGVRILSREV
jgi:putative DNA primase/helicase